MLRTAIAHVYAVSLVLLHPGMDMAAPARAQISFPPSVRSVSGVAPDVNGDVAFGCPTIPPVTLGSSMAFNGMSNTPSSCSLVAIGPLETQAQSATDIAAAIVPLCTIAACTPAAFAFGSPNSRTLSLATAFQATNTAKAAVVSINITSTAAITLSGGATNTATVVIGSTNAVAGGTGTAICSYSNSNTGTLTIGLALNTTAASTCTFALPAGWFFALRQTAGTISVTSAFDQAAG